MMGACMPGWHFEVVVIGLHREHGRSKLEFVGFRDDAFDAVLSVAPRHLILEAGVSREVVRVLKAGGVGRLDLLRLYEDHDGMIEVLRRRGLEVSTQQLLRSANATVGFGVTRPRMLTAYKSGSRHLEMVNVLTRTSRRPEYFSDLVESLQVQVTSGFTVRHLVSYDAESAWYVRGHRPSLRDAYLASGDKGVDMEDLCRCQKEVGTYSPGKRSCGSAPTKDQRLRQKFFDCFCEASYPANRLVELLEAKVSDGWVMYLDDDNLLAKPTSLQEMLDSAIDEDTMVLWYSKLGRLTPQPNHFGLNEVFRGDVDASGFMFHSKHLSLTRWGRTRCGDYRTASSLASSLKMHWIGQVLVRANPARANIGGLGMRGDKAPLSGATLVLFDSGRDSTSAPALGRLGFLRRTIRHYCSERFQDLLHKVLLIWNQELTDAPVPEHSPRHTYTLKVIEVPPTSSSLLAVAELLPHVRTKAVILMDVAVFVDHGGLSCALSVLNKHQHRLIMPHNRVNTPPSSLSQAPSSSFTRDPASVIIFHRHYLNILLYDSNITGTSSPPMSCMQHAITTVAAQAAQDPPLRLQLAPHTIFDLDVDCPSEVVGAGEHCPNAWPKGPLQHPTSDVDDHTCTSSDGADVGGVGQDGEAAQRWRC